jgi:hypothetical protein
VALAEDVIFRLEPGGETTILSAAQAAELERRLEALDLRGAVEVRLAERSATFLPGQAIDLVIDDVVVGLSADPEPVLRPFDPSPTVIVAGGVWCLGLASSGHGHVPWSSVLPAAVASGALALWWERTMRLAAPVVPERIVIAAWGVALAQALLTTPRMRSLVDHQGAQVFPLLMTANAASALAGRYWRVLAPEARIRITGAAAAALAISLVVLDSPIDWAALMIQLVELAALFLAFDRLQRELDRDHGRLLTEITAGDQATTAQAFDAGRRFVLDLVADTTASARRSLSAIPTDTDDELVAEVHRRLSDAERRLEELRR